MASEYLPVRAWIQAARRRGSIVSMAVCVPLSSMGAMLLTVAECYRLWSSADHYPGVIFPAISELGVDLPQRRVYQAGFVVCGGLLSLGIFVFEELLEPFLLPRKPAHAAGEGLVDGLQVQVVGLGGAPELNGQIGVLQTQEGSGGRWRVKLESGAIKAVLPKNLIHHKPAGPEVDADKQLWVRCLWWAHLSAGGVAAQGAFTLQREICAQCFVHWAGAILFIAGAMQHARASVELYDAAAQRKVPILNEGSVASAVKVRHFILNYSSVFVFMIPLLLQVLPRSSGGGASQGTAEKPAMDPNMMNAMGVMQWGIILQFALFFCTYAVDMRAAALRPLTGDEKPRS